MLNLDTHILVFALTGTLTSAERQALAADAWGISDIVFWELSMLIRRKRIVLDLKNPAVAQVFQQIHVWPITFEIASAIRTLDFHSDPADELIAATSIRHRVPLITRDSRIRASKVVPLAL